MGNVYPILVAGSPVKTGKAIEVKNPYNGKTVANTFLADWRTIDRSIESAVSAFEALKGYPSYKRAEIIGRVSEGIRERSEELARVITLESGKPIKDARGEVKRAANTFQIALEEAKRLNGEVIPLDIQEGCEKRTGIVKRFPVGPVLAITPFNFPLNLVAHKAAPCMACGNPVIVKPSLKTPLSALLLADIITGAGWPEGGISVVPCADEMAEKAVEDERVRVLTFTGSAAVGWKLKGKAGRKKVTLELGGNAGVIVDSGCDMDFAAKRCTTGAFSYAGQVCISVQRIYVHKNIFERFKKRFLENVKELKLGDPLDEKTDIGPMIEEGAVERTEAWVKEAINQGAKLIAGGKRFSKNKNLFPPTVLTNTRPSMKVCSEEVFAPVVTIEPFEDFGDAIKEVNNSLYGLQAGVFTSDIKKIFHAFENLEVGGVVIGDIPAFRTDNMPYGGVKMSGTGREGVRYAIEGMTEKKILVLNLS